MLRSMMYETMPSGCHLRRMESASMPMPIRSSERNKSSACWRVIITEPRREFQDTRHFVAARAALAHTRIMRYAFYPNLEAEVQVPENGILSRTLYNDDHLKVVIFGFAPGQELSAHTAPMAASLYFVRGEAQLTLGEDVREVGAGCFVHMPPKLQHGIAARTPVVLLLTMHKKALD